MATTLLSVVEWARPFLSNLFLLVDGSVEPALTNANMILGTMLGPPFIWEWNRNTANFTCIAGVTDYTKYISDFGHIETASLSVPIKATPVLLQNTQGYLTHGGATKLDFPLPITAGSAILVWVYAPAGLSGAVTDTQSNTYSNVALSFSVPDCWYALNCVAGTTSVDFTAALGPGQSAYVMIREWSGIQAVSAFDVAAGNNAIAVSGISSLTLNTTHENEIIGTFGMSTAAGTITAGLESVWSNSWSPPGFTGMFLSEDQLTTSEAPYVSTVNFGATSGNKMISVAFQTISTPAPTDAGNIYELQPRRQLQTSFQPGRPGFINILSDDLAGNITFRLGSCNPDQAYTFKVCYQKAPSFFTENVKANVPIPDKLMHIFRYGFLAMAYLYNNDPKFAEMNQKFVATLLGAQSGLDVAQRNIFLGNWYSMLTDMGVLGGVANQGIQARGSM